MPEVSIPNDWVPVSRPPSKTIPDDFVPVAPGFNPANAVPVEPPSRPAAPGFNPSNFTAVSPAPSSAAPKGPLPTLRHDVQSEIDKAAATHGVPDWALRSIASIESGGTADPTRAVNPNSQASGVMQLLPATFSGVSPKGNIFNLRDNVDAGARYYRQMFDRYHDPVKAAGAYNFGPGNFDEYLAGKRSLPAETVSYMARVAAAQTPSHIVPTPEIWESAKDFVKTLTRPIAGTAEAATTVPADFTNIAKPLPTKAPRYAIGQRAPTQKRTNLDPTKGYHDPLTSLAGHQDALFILSNAAEKDRMLGTGSKYHDEALHMWATNPGAAEDMYGPNSKSMLEAYRDHGSGVEKAEASYLLKHPWAAAGESFFEEFFNPVSILEGGVIGRGLGLGTQALSKTQAGMRLLHFASPFSELVAKHGENARNLIAQMGANISRRDKDAMATAKEVFGGHTLGEQHEIVRLKQGLAPAIPGRPDLAAKAALLHGHLARATHEQLAAGALDPANVYDARTFFPMRGSYDHPVYNPDTMSFMDQLRPNMRSGPTTPFAKPTTQHRVNATFDDSLRDPHFDKTKFVPASNLYNFLKARGGNVEFEKGIKNLALKHPDLIRLGQAFVPVNRLGQQMIKASDALGNVASPSLANAHVAPELVKFLQKGGAAVATGVPDGLAPGSALSRLTKAFDSYNKAFRASIMLNPLYHPFWNIATNSSVAAREELPGVMRNYGRAVLGTAFSTPEMMEALGLKGVSQIFGRGRDAIEHKFWTGSQQYAQDMLDAQKAGAMAEFGAGRSALGGDAAKIRTLASSSLSKPEQIDKFLTGIADWNTHATFGPRGEEGFASTLFKKFTDPNGNYRMKPEDAAWKVREALGNYQNINPNAWQSKLLFFYPWLKTSVPFWLHTCPDRATVRDGAGGCPCGGNRRSQATRRPRTRATRAAPIKRTSGSPAAKTPPTPRFCH